MYYRQPDTFLARAATKALETLERVGLLSSLSPQVIRTMASLAPPYSLHTVY
jgi:hypothetical protein